jgi:hypothetical protein
MVSPTVLFAASLTSVGGSFVSHTAVLLDPDSDQLGFVNLNPAGSGESGGWKVHLAPGT